jgi:hypothetical protein
MVAPNDHLNRWYGSIRLPVSVMMSRNMRLYSSIRKATLALLTAASMGAAAVASSVLAVNAAANCLAGASSNLLSRLGAMQRLTSELAREALMGYADCLGVELSSQVRVRQLAHQLAAWGSIFSQTSICFQVHSLMLVCCKRSSSRPSFFSRDELE